ncbi:MAG: methyltransferase domain-containing protein [Bacteroidales bacterium]|nr:methyltransferase domain-containing protein [Bacteroidales bacterium]
MSKSLEDIIFDLVELFRPYIEGIDSVLDIGTGTSIPIHIFAKNFPKVRYNTVDVVDIRKGKKLPFVIYDGKNLPFGNLEFDVSLLNETLHHCEDPESVLIEARRVAKSIYVIEHFPNPNANLKELVKTEIDALINFDINCQIYKPFTEHSLYLLFKKIGLKVWDKIEIPYYGKREIRKYFFKLK